jgi:hypothetical protein
MRSDGSAVASFAFSAFGPTPEAIREAAEEDYRKGRRRAQGDEDGEEGRGGEVALGELLAEISAHLEDAAEERLGENGKSSGRHEAGL